MGFKQPRVPEYRDKEGMERYIRTLVLFLKDFCQEVWSQSRMQEKAIGGVQKGVDEIRYPVTSVNAKTGDVTLEAGDVGALEETYRDELVSLIRRWNAATNQNHCSNIDAPSQSGMYHCDTSTSGTKPSAYGDLLHITETPLWAEHQIFWGSGGGMWYRFRNNGGTENAAAWGEWMRYLSALEIYPVGAIYISAAATSPASLFGGTWEQIQNIFLLAAGSYYANGAMGGTDYHQHQYGLQYGAFYGDLAMEGAAYGAAGLLSYGAGNAVSITGGGWRSGSQNFTINGGSEWSNKTVTADTYQMAANTSYASNMPPYLAVYMWKRVS